MDTEAKRAWFTLHSYQRWGPFCRIDVPYKGYYETSFYFKDVIKISFKRRYKE